MFVFKSISMSSLVSYQVKWLSKCTLFCSLNAYKRPGTKPVMKAAPWPTCLLSCICLSCSCMCVSVLTCASVWGWMCCCENVPALGISSRNRRWQLTLESTRERREAMTVDMRANTRRLWCNRPASKERSRWSPKGPCGTWWIVFTNQLSSLNIFAAPNLVIMGGIQSSVCSSVIIFYHKLMWFKCMGNGEGNRWFMYLSIFKILLCGYFSPSLKELCLPSKMEKFHI